MRREREFPHANQVDTMRRMCAPIAVAALCAAAVTASAQTNRAPTLDSRIIQQLKEQPVWFEENAGGSSQPHVAFLFRGNRYALALTRDEVMLAVNGRSSAGDGSLVHLRLVGATAREPVGIDLLPGKTYYATGTLGPIAANRRFRRVRYDDVYPGIDAIYHGDNDRLEFDFVVSPHVDPDQLRLALTGADDIELADSGDLVVRIGASEVLLRQPVAYQEIDGVRRTVPARFHIDERSTVTFALGDYDRSQPLIIDPTIAFATFIGSEKLDSIASLETDASGTVYISGSIPFDATSLWASMFMSFGQGPANSPQCYFAKLTRDGNGGLTYDYIAIVRDGYGCGAMAVAPNGSVAVSGPIQVTNGVVRLFSMQSGSLVQSAVFAVPMQQVDHLRLDNTGRVYSVGLCGQQVNPGSLWPLPNGAQPNPTPGLCRNPNAVGGADTQEVLVVTDATGQITYGTFIGTGATELDVTSLDVDSIGRAWVAGHTTDGLVKVTADAFQAQGGGASDAFLAILDPSSTGDASLRYASYFGGSGVERDVSFALQPSGRVYLAGNTTTLSGFPGRDFIDPAIFLSVFDLSQPPENQLLSTTAVVESPLTSLYSNFEAAPAMRLLPNGSIVFLADSVDSLFPLVQPLYSGPYDATKPNPLRPLLLVYDPVASAYTFATFLDNVQQARFPRVAAGAAGSMYVAMTTSESGRSTDASAPLGLGDVLLFAISGGQPANQPPTVSISYLGVAVTTVYADSPSGATLPLDAFASDPDGDSLTYSWTGPFINSPVTTNSSIVARLALGMQQTITVTVDDGHGNVVSASRTFDVVGTPFVGTTATPIDSAFNGLVFNYSPVTITATESELVPATCIFAAGSISSRRSRRTCRPDRRRSTSTCQRMAALIAPITVCVDTRGMSFASAGNVRLYQAQQSGRGQTSRRQATRKAINCAASPTTLGTFAIFYPQVPATAVQTIAGNGVREGSNDGAGGNPIDDYVDGPATSTALDYLYGGAYDRASNHLFISSGGYILRLNLNDDTIARVAGNGVGPPGAIDGPGGDPRDDLVDGGDAFDTYVGFPAELALNPSGDVVFFDRDTCRIRRLDVAQSRLFAVAGNGVCGFSGDGASAGFASISHGQMAFDAAGHLFLADSAMHASGASTH